MNNQTKTTSHFLGINLNTKLFSDLINSLQRYSKESIIELQSQYFLHITLYYFGQELDENTLFNLRNELLKLNKKENLFPVFINKVNFFKKDRQDYLCYLFPSKSEKIKEINSKLKQKYNNKTIDNNYPKYIPHMTLFRIKNFNLYQEHQEKILSIIKTFLKRIDQNNVFISFNLFSANSKVSPEKYKIVF